MENNQFPFKVLFCFEGESRLIAEIKRTDVQSEDKSLVYKWLLMEKLKQNEELDEGRLIIRQLTFESMEQAEGKQTRNFAEGVLVWNETGADFNGERMRTVETEELPEEVWGLVFDFLV